MTNKNEFHLERALGELETIVHALEGNDLSLEAALKQFEKGVKITKQCQAALGKAEQKIQILTQNGLEAFEDFEELA